jgi:hypothetical protein
MRRWPVESWNMLAAYSVGASDPERQASPLFYFRLEYSIRIICPLLRRYRLRTPHLLGRAARIF